MHISTMNILQTVTDRINIIIFNTQEVVYWYIYIWPWAILMVKVKVMHISNVNISQTVTARKNIAIANTLKVAYELSFGIFTFDRGLF